VELVRDPEPFHPDLYARGNRYEIKKVPLYCTGEQWRLAHKAKLKAQALAKLTADERKALGL
jgi:hypothetical protein